MHAALTDKSHWDEVWTFVGEASRAAAPRLEESPLTRWLERIFAARLGPGRNFLEIGAGGSPWPGHIAAKYGATAWGIDISQTGLQQTARACAEGAPVRLVEGDFFDGAALPSAAFDVIYSGGFIEHFTDPAPVAERMFELCAPGAIVVTTVPNLGGVNGWLQRLADPKLFEAHVVLTPQGLDRAHARGRLEPVEPALHLGLIDLGAVNFMRLSPRLPRRLWQALWFSLSRVRAAGEWLAESGGPKDGGRVFAPMIGGVYRRPDESQDARGLGPRAALATCAGPDLTPLCTKPRCAPRSALKLSRLTPTPP
jgi:SAM-dependent methyltransferase